MGSPSMGVRRDVCEVFLSSSLFPLASPTPRRHRSHCSPHGRASSRPISPTIRARGHVVVCSSCCPPPVVRGACSSSLAFPQTLPRYIKDNLLPCSSPHSFRRTVCILPLDLADLADLALSRCLFIASFSLPELLLNSVFILPSPRPLFHSNLRESSLTLFFSRTVLYFYLVSSLHPDVFLLFAFRHRLSSSSSSPPRRYSVPGPITVPPLVFFATDKMRFWGLASACVAALLGSM